MSRKRHANDGPGPIPQRWLYCPRKSFSLVGGKFLAFKTPLGQKFDNQVGAECFWHPEMVFSSAKDMLKKVGLWIDLTNTDRFYDKSIVEAMDCKYVKLNCKGHGETPQEDAINTFVRLCKKFIERNPLQIIAVHCTHGFNRTGFLIVSYLVQVLDWSVEAAVAEFATARPPGIYKGDYIHELFRLYGDIEDAPEPPALPDWHSESDDGPSSRPAADGNVEDDNDAGSSGTPKKKKRREGQKAIFMEGIPSVEPAPADVVTTVQKRIKTLTGFGSNGFPGAQPVSMDRNNLSLLASPYMVSWKADGTRYMMYIKGPNEVYFIDRDNAVFQIKGLTFPHRKDRSRHLVDTLLDGEMVIDVVGEAKHPRYLIYDFVSFEGNQICHDEFKKRYPAIQKEIIDPRIQAMKEGRISREREPIGVRRKEFWDLPRTSYLLSEKFTRQLGHEPDGLIFQPADESYQPGQCPTILKWKPPSHNSIDFRIKIIKENRPGFLPGWIGELYVGGCDTKFAEMNANKRDIQALDNKIVECRWDGERNRWVFMRERTDKSFPNSFKTAAAVLQSIKEPVTKKILLDFVERIKPPFVAPAAPHPAQRRPV